MKNLTANRKFQLKQDAEWAGFRVGFSEDGRFTWIVINEKGDCRFMNALETYPTWRIYESTFKWLVNIAMDEVNGKDVRGKYEELQKYTA